MSSIWDGRCFWNGDTAIPLPESHSFPSVVSFPAILQLDGIKDPKPHIENIIEELRKKKKLMTAELDESFFAHSIDLARIEVDNKHNVWIRATFLECLCLLRYAYAILIKDVEENEGDVGEAQLYLGRQATSLMHLEGKFGTKEEMLGNEVAFVEALRKGENLAWMGQVLEYARKFSKL